MPALHRIAVAPARPGAETAITDTNRSPPESTMNTTVQALAFAAVVTAASAATIGLGLVDRVLQPRAEVVKLERVVVIGKRAEASLIAQLPRVVIVGRSSAAQAADVQLAAAKKEAASKAI
jgi:hypothetical protein